MGVQLQGARTLGIPHEHLQREINEPWGVFATGVGREREVKPGLQVFGTDDGLDGHGGPLLRYRGTGERGRQLAPGSGA